ncbi:DUF1707 SHOCT-like domain-containing protein [Geodermatophilus sp. SYSU D00815]
MTAPTDDGTAATPGPGPRMRASDAQREAVVHRIHDAVAAGMLSIDEGHERTTAAFAARYVDDLPPLTADLPDPAPVAPGWRALASTAALQARTSVLGAGSWAAADRTRRRVVLLAGLLVALMLVIALTAAATASAADLGGGWDHHHHHDYWD